MQAIHVGLTKRQKKPGSRKVRARLKSSLNISGRKCSRYQKTRKLKGRTLACLVHS